MTTPTDRRDESWSVAITETITYQRDFTRADLAHLTDTDLDDATDTDVIDHVSGHPAVEQALQHYGEVNSGEWLVTPTHRPPRHDSTGPGGHGTSATDDYATARVPGRDLAHAHVLLGEAGGHSAVYETRDSSAMPGLVCVETEHGPLYLDPDQPYTVLAET